MAPGYRIGELGAADAAGTKARNLDTLVRAGFRVPRGIVLPASWVWDALLPERPMPPEVNAGLGASGRLCSAIWSASAEKLAARLSATVAVAGLREPLAVRSSSTLEDGGSRSSAGLFRSLLHVRLVELADAVREVWVSGYSAITLALHGSVRADHNAVIVQELVAASASGVCFSADPVRPSDEILIDCVAGLSADLLAGTVAGAAYRVRRGDGRVTGPDDGPLTAAQASAVAVEVRRVEELYGCPVDVEFALTRNGSAGDRAGDGSEDGRAGDGPGDGRAGDGSGGEAEARPWIVQARPMTPPARRRRTNGGPPRRPCVVELDDLTAARGLATGALAELLSRRTDKRHYVRQAARRRGFAVAGEWLLASAQDAAERIERICRTEIVELGLPSGHWRRTRRIDAAGVLRRAAASDDVVFVAELHVGATCGFAAVRDDDALVVEYVPGAGGGLMYGTGPYSRVVVAADGAVLSRELRPAASYWELNPADLEFHEVPVSRTPEPLSGTDLTALRAIVDGMRAEFGEVRVEWLRTAAGLLLLWDLTVEDGRPLRAVDQQVIAPGSARGKAVVLTDLREFEEILDDRSVIAGREFYAAHGSGPARRARTRAFGGIERPIVVTAFPKTTLTLLLGHVAGFVFDEAALLAHLPIILREQGIPAIRRPAATSILRTGDLIEIGADGVWVVP